MRRTPLVAAVLIGGLTFVSTPSVTATATPTAGGGSSSSTSGSSLAADLAPDSPPAGRTWIQGVVVDQAGRPRDNVLVQAFIPWERQPRASWLTYADPADGKPHGWFRLYVPGGPKTWYQLKFSSPAGAEDPFRTVKTQADYRARGGDIVEVPDTALQLVRTADSRTRVWTDRKASKARTWGKVTIKVTSPDVKPVVGDVVVRVNGTKLRSFTLGERRQGRMRINLPGRKPGTYRIKATFKGADNVHRSSDVHKLKVEPKRRKR